MPVVAGLDPTALQHFVKEVLAEDLGEGGDVTSAFTIPARTRLRAVVRSRQDIVLAGVDLACAFFAALDPDSTLERCVADGDRVGPEGLILRVEGDARALLAAERSALNTLQHLSGIATLTRDYADLLVGSGCVLLDTRKTIPGLRVLEKYAARIGGARNHRMRLDDAILIKDNHVALCGGVAEAVQAAKASGLQVQVEVDLIEQITPAIMAGADRLVCDNMTPDMLRRAVALVARRVPMEASGGVRLDTIRAIAETGVDFVSVGRITQSAPAVDIGLDYQLGDTDTATNFYNPIEDKPPSL